jgi:hypothetical protein
MAKPIDAAATLLGWINHTATDQDERTIAPGTIIKLSTPLDAAEVFTFVASHPGHSAALTFTLEVAPERLDGTLGSWVQAAQVAIPAAGGRVEAPINGGNLSVASGDASDVGAFSLYFARCQTTVPGTPPNPPVAATVTGAYAGLTF